MLSHGICSLWLSSASSATLDLAVPGQPGRLNPDALCIAWLLRGAFRGFSSCERWDRKIELHTPVLIVEECHSVFTLHFVSLAFKKGGGGKDWEFKLHHCICKDEIVLLKGKCSEPVLCV